MAASNSLLRSDFCASAGIIRISSARVVTCRSPLTVFDLANSFHAFYEACPVLKSDEPARSSRLALCALTARVLQRGLYLLGIEVPEKM